MFQIGMDSFLFNFFNPVQTRVIGNSIDPSGQLGIPFKAWQGLVYLNKYILRHLLGLLSIAQHPYGQCKDQIFIAIHQIGERMGVTPTYFQYQFFFFVGQHCSLDAKSAIQVTQKINFIKTCNLFVKTFVIAYEQINYE